MEDRVLWASGHGIVLLIGLAGLAFATGYWGILIALAPAAYLLILFPQNPENTPQAVVATHFMALAAGWLAYTILAAGVSPLSVDAMSTPGLRLLGSSVVAFLLTTAGFYALHVRHSMAYVTTFTAAIGAFRSVRALTVVAIAILFVAGLQFLRRKLGPDLDTPTNRTARVLDARS